MQKICIITDKHISTNPRVWKEAKTLFEGGYSVSIVTMFRTLQHIEKDEELLKDLNIAVKYIPAVNLIPGHSPFLSTIFYKSRAKVALLLKKAGVDSIYILNYAPEKLLQAAMNENADLYIAHVECGLYAGKQLIHKGKKVAFDIEDWYSNDYLVSTRPVQLLKQLEAFALEQGVYSSCPSNEMANALHRAYPKSKMPIVLYNGFPIEPFDSQLLPPSKEMTRLIWFSQTVGSGRGLEKIIAALGSLSIPVKLTLIGNCSTDYKEHLEKLFPFDNGHILEFINFVKHSELYDILLHCDIGLAIEDNYPGNKNVTVSNKILQYLQAGIKVFATNTAGQVEVAGYFPGAVKIVDADNNTDWAIQLNELIHNEVDREFVIEQHNRLFSWDAQEDKLLQIVSNAIEE